MECVEVWLRRIHFHICSLIDEMCFVILYLNCLVDSFGVKADSLVCKI